VVRGGREVLGGETATAWRPGNGSRAGLHAWSWSGEFRGAFWAGAGVLERGPDGNGVRRVGPKRTVGPGHRTELWIR
jgi:hypothetical protein